ncbi:MAG: hypothetical protein QXY52_00375 [Conexivisphaerales archaeon]
MTNKKRGYDWEDKLVKQFDAAGWTSIRLGSPSIHLPDVLAISNRENAMVAIEAKSSMGDRIIVKREQILRLFEFLSIFKVYRNRTPVIAIKFLRIHGKGLEEKYYTVYQVPDSTLIFSRGSKQIPKGIKEWRPPFRVDIKK